MRESIIIKFNKEFVKGNQYIDINTYNGKTFQDITKNYWWQSREVYNLLAPIVEMIIKKNPKSFTDKELYGRGSIVDMLIPYQRAYNATKNRQSEYLNRLTCANLFVEDGSVDIDALEDEGLAPGKILIYRQGAQIPKLVKSNYSIEVYNLIKKEAEEIREEMYKIVFDYLDNISYKSGE